MGLARVSPPPPPGTSLTPTPNSLSTFESTPRHSLAHAASHKPYYFMANDPQMPLNSRFTALDTSSTAGRTEQPSELHTHESCHQQLQGQEKACQHCRSCRNVDICKDKVWVRGSDRETVAIKQVRARLCAFGLAGGRPVLLSRECVRDSGTQ
jgi:hypothetical protein